MRGLADALYPLLGAVLSYARKRCGPKKREGARIALARPRKAHWDFDRSPLPRIRRFLH
jgi:hypothetical protein